MNESTPYDDDPFETDDADVVTGNGDGASSSVTGDSPHSEVSYHVLTTTELVKNFLKHYRLDDALRALDAELNTKKLEPPKPHPTIRSLVEAFDQGSQDTFFSSFRALSQQDKGDSNQTIAKLEYRLHVYFTVFPLLEGAGSVSDRQAAYQENQQKFKSFLESDGKDLASVPEFVSYCALPFIPNPLDHAAFTECVSLAWRTTLRDDLKAYLDTKFTPNSTVPEEPELVDLVRAGSSNTLLGAPVSPVHKHSGDSSHNSTNHLENLKPDGGGGGSMSNSAELGQGFMQDQMRQLEEYKEHIGTLVRDMVAYALSMTKMENKQSEQEVEGMRDKLIEYLHVFESVSGRADMGEQTADRKYVVSPSHTESKSRPETPELPTRRTPVLIPLQVPRGGARSVQTPGSPLPALLQHSTTVVPVTPNTLQQNRAMYLQQAQELHSNHSRSNSVPLPMGPLPVRRITALEMSTLRHDLCRLPDLRKCCILQALRWRLKRVPRANASVVIDQYIQGDLLELAVEDFHASVRSSEKHVLSGQAAHESSRSRLHSVSERRRGDLLRSLLMSQNASVRESTARLLNAMASFWRGRSYMLDYKDMIQLIYSCIIREPSDTITRQNALGALQKCSLRRRAQLTMIHVGVVDWVFGELAHFHTLSDYTIEYSTALITNLVLRTAGKQRCERPKLRVIPVLTSLLNHPVEEIRGYINGALYHLLSRRRIRAAACGTNLEERIESIRDVSTGDMQVQYDFLLTRLNSDAGEETEMSDVENEVAQEEADARAEAIAETEAEADAEDGEELIEDELSFLSRNLGPRGEELLQNEYHVTNQRSQSPARHDQSPTKRHAPRRQRDDRNNQLRRSQPKAPERAFLIHGVTPSPTRGSRVPARGKRSQVRSRSPSKKASKKSNKPSFTNRRPVTPRSRAKRLIQPRKRAAR